MNDRAVAAHLAYAISRYLPWARDNGLRPPVDDLVGIADQLLTGARPHLFSGHAGPTFASDGTEMQVRIVSVAPILVRLPEAARLLAISETALKRLVAAGEIPAHKVGGTTVFRVEDLEVFAAGLAPRPFRQDIVVKGDRQWPHPADQPRPAQPTRRVTIHRKKAG